MKLPSLIFLAAVSALPAATLTVTSTADSGAGSLRNTIVAAATGDTITFGGAAFTGPETTVTIRLTSGNIAIPRALTINGITNTSGGNKVIITGDADASGGYTAGDSRGLNVSFHSGGGTTTLHRLTFEHCGVPLGFNGGAVTSFGGSGGNGIVVTRCRFLSNTATSGGAWFAFDDAGANPVSFSNCRFESNSALDAAGAVHISGLGGAATFESCTFANNSVTHSNSDGGALRIDSTVAVQIDRCLFSENAAQHTGGALAVDKTSATITRSLFQGNSADSGGGIWFTNFGGPPLASGVTHCTFSGNRSGHTAAALFATSGTEVTLEHCTITGNASNTEAEPGDAGAVTVGDSSIARFHSNLIAANTDGRTSGTRHPDVQLTSGTALSLGGNVIGDATGSGTTFNGPNDLDGTAANPIPAGVLPLADHGGPTLTHALQPLAAAVDFAASSTATEDQRGEARPSGSARDAGAFERQLVSFADWAADRLAAYPVSERQANDDPDLDGLSNGIEFIQGTAPANANLPLDRVEIDGGGTWYSFTISNEADLDTLTAEIEQSDNLATWQASSINNKSLGALIDSANATRTRYRLPVSTAGRPKHFLRMNVRPLQLNN